MAAGALRQPVELNVGRMFLVGLMFALVIGIGIYRIETNRVETGRQGRVIEGQERVIKALREGRRQDRAEFKALLKELRSRGQISPDFNPAPSVSVIQRPGRPTPKPEPEVPAQPMPEPVPKPPAPSPPMNPPCIIAAVGLCVNL